MQNRRNKYNAIKVKEDGITFDSKAEHRRYCELKLLLKAGEICSLKVHPRYRLEVGDNLIGVYEADFEYHELKAGKPQYRREVVEDVKGVRTREYILKRNLFKALNPYTDFRERSCRT